MKMLGWILLLKIRDAGVCSVRGCLLVVCSMKENLDLGGSCLSLAFCWCRESIGAPAVCRAAVTRQLVLPITGLAAPLGFSGVD